MTRFATRRTCSSAWIRSAIGVAALTIASAGFAQTAAKKPNILVIWGDDIGRDNISAYSMGDHGLQDAQHRSYREGRGAVHRLVRPAELHRRPRVVHPRRAPVPHRAADDRHAGFAAGHPRLGADDRRSAEGAGLRHRPVRQEPPRRPRLAPADGARLRRVPRQPLPPQRRGGAGDLLLPEGSRLQEEVSARAACCTPDATARAARRSRTPARSPASGCRPSIGRSTPPRPSSSTRREGREAVLRLAQHDPHARVDPPDKAPEGGPGSASIPTAWWCTTTWSARC